MTLISTSTKDCMHAAGLALYVRTESMKRRANDGRTIHIYIYTYTIYCAHCCTVYVELAQARPNYMTMARRQDGSKKFRCLRACECGDIETVRELVETGSIDPNWVSEIGYSSGHRVKGLGPLHLSCG